jgi:hypothetical protein
LLLLGSLSLASIVAAVAAVAVAHENAQKTPDNFLSR